MTCIKSRRSIRSFEKKKVEKETIEQIIECARFAPSWKNTQTARYTVVSNEALKEKIAMEAVIGFDYNRTTIRNAAALVVVSCVHGRSGFERDGSFSTKKEDRWEIFDAGIATQTFCLAAHEIGVGSVIMGIFEEEKVKELISLPENQVVCALIAIGYAEKEVQAPKRKLVEELVSYCE